MIKHRHAQRYSLLHSFPASLCNGVDCFPWSYGFIWHLNCFVWGFVCLIDWVFFVWLCWLVLFVCVCFSLLKSVKTFPESLYKTLEQIVSIRMKCEHALQVLSFSPCSEFWFIFQALFSLYQSPLFQIETHSKFYTKKNMNGLVAPVTWKNQDEIKILKPQPKQPTPNQTSHQAVTNVLGGSAGRPPCRKGHEEHYCTK